MSIPLVSVCVPVYNGAAHLGEAIRSVLAQSFQDFELLILDNCSTDQTWELATSFTDARIKTHRHPYNIGAQGNWNKAVELASGRYFKILCHDDILLPLCLEKQVAVLEDPRNARAGLTCCGRIVANSQGTPLLSRKFKGRGGIIPGRDAIIRTLRSGTNLIGEPAAVLVRTDCIKNTEGFDASYPYVIDLGMWCNLLENHDLFFLNENLVIFRAVKTSWSFAIAGKQANDFTGFLRHFLKETNMAIPRDVWFRGVLTAHVNNLLRRLFYMVFLRG